MVKNLLAKSNKERLREYTGGNGGFRRRRKCNVFWSTDVWGIKRMEAGS